MALITANELKRKLLITVDGQPYVVLEVFFASPTARGAATMVRTRLRQLLTGAVMEKSFRSSEKFAEPDIELSPASFLYSDAHGFHFMDEKSFEQFTFDEAALDADRGYLKEGVSLQVLKYNGAPVSLQLPQYVELAVTSTELGLRGAGAKRILVRLLLESAPHEQRDSLVRHPLSSTAELFGLISSWIKEWQPRAPITEMWIELPVLEAAGRRQLRLWAGGDGNSEEVVAALERLQERWGDEVVHIPRPHLLSSPIPSQRFA